MVMLVLLLHLRYLIIEAYVTNHRTRELRNLHHIFDWPRQHYFGTFAI